MDWLLLSAVLFYLVFLFVLGAFATTKVKNEEDFIVAGRRLPLWLAWGTLLATWFGAASMLGASETARLEGVRGTLIDPFASGLCLIFAGLFFAKPLWEMKILTMGDFYRIKFGPRAEVVASVMLVPSYFGWIGAQFVALAMISQEFFDLPPEVGIFVAAAIVISYSLSGGMWSVTITDTAQLFVMLIGLVILGWIVISELGDGHFLVGSQTLLEKTPADRLTLLPESNINAGLAWIAILGSGICGNMPGQDLMQRVFASKSSRVAVWACILAGMVYLLFGLIPVAMGLASNILAPEKTNDSAMTFLAQRFLSPGLKIVFVISLISIIISTATSAVLSPATIVARNLLEKWPLFQGHSLFNQRLCVFVVSVAGIVMAFSGESIIGLLELSIGMTLVGLFIPLVAGIYLHWRSELAAILAMVVGTLVWLIRIVPEEFAFLFWGEPAESMEYADLLWNTLQTWNLPGFIRNAVYIAFIVPGELNGTLASAVAYVVGIVISLRKVDVKTD